MTDHSTDHSAVLADFDAAISVARGADAAFKALQDLARATVGAKLFTVMLVDMPNDVARRAYTSDPENYPASGTKPINYGPWFDIVHKQRQFFVANTIEDIAKVLFDHELIDALGCQSVVNVPLILGDELVATMNLLDVAGHYTPERLETIRTTLTIPAKLAVLAARL